MPFPDSVRRAWDYILSALEQGLRPTEALRQYREGGGKIRTQDWYRAYHTVDEYSDTWDLLSRYRDFEQLPEDFFAPAPRYYRKQYVVVVDVGLRYTSTRVYERTYRNIEFNYRPSISEINIALDEMGRTGTDIQNEWTSEYIYGYKFYTRG